MGKYLASVILLVSAVNTYSLVYYYHPCSSHEIGRCLSDPPCVVASACAGLVQLEKLLAGWCSGVKDDDVQALAGLTNLIELELARTKVERYMYRLAAAT